MPTFSPSKPWLLQNLIFTALSFVLKWGWPIAGPEKAHLWNWWKSCCAWWILTRLEERSAAFYKLKWAFGLCIYQGLTCIVLTGFATFCGRKVGGTRPLAFWAGLRAVYSRLLGFGWNASNSWLDLLAIACFCGVIGKAFAKYIRNPAFERDCPLH